MPDTLPRYVAPQLLSILPLNHTCEKAEVGLMGSVPGEIITQTKADRGQLLDWLNLAAILTASFLMAALRWTKLNSLVHDDPAMWLLQMARAAQGELPYRDFSWNYPPFSSWLFSAVFRAFGSTFPVAQATMDMLSVIVVLLSYWVMRLTLPRVLHFPVIFLLIAVGGTAQTKFTLFSLLTYSPALLTATVGLLMMMIGSLLFLRAVSWSGLTMSLVISGAFIASTSKPESFIASLALVLGLVVFGPAPRWTVQSAFILGMSITPALLAFAWEAQRVGLENFKAGMSGYGLATMACPWWPTGLGVFGALASLAQAVGFAALATLPFWRQLTAAYGRKYRLLLLSSIPCVLFYLGYYAYLNHEELASGHSILYKLKQVLPLLLWTSPVLLPVMWASIGYCCWYVYRRQNLELFLILSVPVVMSFRSLFGTTLFPYTEVSALCYPLFLLAGPLLLWELLSSVLPAGDAYSRRACLVVASVALLYSAARLVGGYSLLLSNGGYTTLSTAAGQVRIRNDDGSADIYRYVMEKTGPQDTILDIPYGGGVNLAAHRDSPLFTTQFEQLRPSLEHQLKDVALIRKRPPAIIIAEDKPFYGVAFGYPFKIACACPRLVWQPDELAGDPTYVFPLVRWIDEHYRVERKIGARLILVPK